MQGSLVDRPDERGAECCGGGGGVDVVVRGGDRGSRVLGDVGDVAGQLAFSPAPAEQRRERGLPVGGELQQPKPLRPTTDEATPRRQEQPGTQRQIEGSSHGRLLESVGSAGHTDGRADNEATSAAEARRSVLRPNKLPKRTLQTNK